MFAVLQGQVLLAGAADATVWMWEALTGTCLQVFAGHEGSVTCGQFGYKKGKVHTHTHTHTSPAIAPHCARVESSKGTDRIGGGGGTAVQVVVTASVDGTARVWNRDSASCLHKFTG